MTHLIHTPLCSLKNAPNSSIKKYFLGHTDRQYRSTHRALFVNQDLKEHIDATECKVELITELRFSYLTDF